MPLNGLFGEIIMLEGLGDMKMLEGFFNLSFVFRPGELLLKRVIFFSLFGV